MAFVLKIFKTLRNHWKKSVFISGIAIYGVKYGRDRYEEDLLRRVYCAEARLFGEERIGLDQKPRRITLFLNPAACLGRSKKLFEKNAAPVLYLTGMEVNVVMTEYEGQVKKFMNVLETKDVNGIVVAGGDGTLIEAVTGFMKKEDKMMERVVKFKLGPHEKALDSSLQESCLIPSPSLRLSDRVSSSSTDEPPPKLPKLYLNYYHNDSDDGEIIFQTQEEVVPRRVTRRSTIDSPQKDQGLFEVFSSSATSSASQEKSARRMSLSRNSNHRERRVSGTKKKESRKSCNGSSESSSSKLEPAPIETARYSTRSTDPPPPLVIPYTVSSVSQDGAGDANEKQGETSDTYEDSGKEEIMNILKLPGLLSKMDMATHKLNAFVKLTKYFLEYVIDHQAELFPDDAYVSTSEAV